MVDEVSDVADVPHHTFESVREDTAELASKALSESRSPRLTHVPNATYSTDPSPVRNQHRLRDGKAEELPSVPNDSTSTSSDTQLPPRNEAKALMLTQMIESPSPRERTSATDTTLGYGTHDHFDSVLISPGIISQPHESTPLLRNGSTRKSNQLQAHGHFRDPESLLRHNEGYWKYIRRRFDHKLEKVWIPFRQVRILATSDRRKLWRLAIIQPIAYTPAIILGLLMNVLDALSYGKSLGLQALAFKCPSSC